MTWTMRNTIISEGHRKHGDKFSDASISSKFLRFYRTDERIKVQFPCGTIKTGTVGKTTGWAPSFLLILTKRSMGSSWLLDDRCILLGVRRNGKYV